MTSRKVFNQEMEQLDRDVSQMASLAREAIEKAVRCIISKDPTLKGEVERLDKEIYHMEQIIEKRCLDLIALHAPVAGDLRTVSTCLKVITDLDRIGRYASDIVEVYDMLALDNGIDRSDRVSRSVSIPQMAELVVRMVEDATDSFIRRDDRAARELFDRDDRVDQLYDLNFRAVITYMIEDPRRITVGTHVILVCRYLERIADHACNIGERVVYMVTGERMDPTERKKGNNGSSPARRLPDSFDDLDQGDRSTHELADK